ncbi:MAG: hypothetical protein A2Z99_10920 [Treponema sp. GWB1_62_6]|nr:MAG: hypothetical protein A2Z99_10920 [Treponema sp. GWB1_62_6]OHE77028.1 MAG: hypothetical protein A2413_10095 [Treponema sp. RIFOXYC1_FULL_61_9]
MSELKYFSIALSFLALFALKVYSVDLDSIVGSENAGILRAKGSVKSFSFNGGSPGLLPSFPARTGMESRISAFAPTLIVESLYLYEKPAEIGNGRLTDGAMLAVFNALGSISTLTGIQYYSASRGRMRTFYESSFVVEGELGNEVLADPVAATLPARATLFAIQKDLTFGENRYRYDYETGSGYILFSQENLTAMNYGILPILGKRRLRTMVAVIDTADALVVYCISAAKASLLPGLDGKVRDSFSNRADALFSWFGVHAEKALTTTPVKN